MSIHNYTTPNRILYYNYQYIRLQQLLTKMGANASILDGFIEDTNFSIEEIDRLRKRFMKLDKDGSGQIDKQEFLSIPGISSNPLATRLMDVFDKDGDGSIDFEEFITGLSAFSGKSDNLNKLRFAFNIYDIDRDENDGW